MQHARSSAVAAIRRSVWFFLGASVAIVGMVAMIIGVGYPSPTGVTNLRVGFQLVQADFRSQPAQVWVSVLSPLALLVLLVVCSGALLRIPVRSKATRIALALPLSVLIGFLVLNLALSGGAGFIALVLPFLVYPFVVGVRPMPP